jgi:hypothetical protein
MSTCSPESMLRVYNNGTDTVIAYSPEDATALLAEHIGENPEDIASNWVELPPEKVIKLSEQSEENPGESRTAAEWHAIKGRGPLCSTEW